MSTDLSTDVLLADFYVRLMEAAVKADDAERFAYWRLRFEEILVEHQAEQDDRLGWVALGVAGILMVLVVAWVQAHGGRLW